MAISTQHVAGFAAGLGLSALGFYLYKKNQATVDQFLNEHGIRVSSILDQDPNAMSIKDLIKAKEDLEDMIAEREYAEGEAQKETSQKK